MRNTAARGGAVTGCALSKARERLQAARRASESMYVFWFYMHKCLLGVCVCGVCVYMYMYICVYICDYLALEVCLVTGVTGVTELTLATGRFVIS